MLEVFGKGDLGTETGGIDGRRGSSEAIPAGGSHTVRVSALPAGRAESQHPLPGTHGVKARKGKVPGLIQASGKSYLLIGTVLVHLDRARTDEDLSAVRRERRVRL